MGADALFGSVVRKVAKAMGGVRPRGKGLDRKRRLEEARIKLYDRYFAEKLSQLYKGFPDISGLPPYVRELLDARVGIDRLKLALGRIKGSLRALEAIRDEILFRMERTRSREDLLRLRKQYLARVYDVLQSLEEDIGLVRYARSQLRRLPPIRQDRPTVVIGGFPNAGKSSLLRALTGSEPEIAPYPFTTKRLLLGHFSDGYRLIQVVDTPGILDRPFERMKPEEKEAVLSMKHLADLVLFLLDPFQDMGAQRRLLEGLKGMFQKPFLTVVGKADLLEEPEGYAREVGAELAVSPLTGYNIDELKALVIKRLEGIKWQ